MTTTIKRDKTFTQPINWITTSFMVAFHIGAVIALIHVWMETVPVGRLSMVGCGEPRHWHGLSQAAHASRL